MTLLLGESFGPWTVKKGKHNYAERREFNNGASIWYTPVAAEGNKGLAVDLPGGALGEMLWADVLDLLLTLTNGLRCSRIDLALDYRGDNVPLIDLSRQAASSGELCRCRRWKPNDDFSGVERIRHENDFGRRGSNGSGKYMRWYDKGLETGEALEGRWVRLEAELSGKVAAAVSPDIMQADDPLEKLMGIALGCVDFRENTGDAHIERRQRLDWWEQVLSGVEVVRVAAPRKQKTLESYCGWIRRCVVNGIKDMAELAGTTVQDVFEDLTAGGPLPLRKPPELNPVAWEYAKTTKSLIGQKIFTDTNNKRPQYMST
ncbi:MAG: replication initiation factor domain-containing protein [Planctomycetota bacterium]